MCVLCGEFVSHIHWAERHVEDEALAAGAVTGEHHRQRRRDRLRRAALANEVAAHYGLRLVDWNGRSYLLTDRKGHSELVEDLGSLWPAVEKLSGRTPDPLNPVLWKALSGQ